MRASHELKGMACYISETSLLVDSLGVGQEFYIITFYSPLKETQGINQCFLTLYSMNSFMNGTARVINQLLEIFPGQGHDDEHSQ